MYEWIYYIDDIDELMKKKKRDVFKYPHFGKISQLYPNPEVVLGHDIYWTLKEDGSNAGVYLKPNGEPTVRSRNVDVANFCRDVMCLPECKRVIDMIYHHKENYGSEFMVFGEYLSARGGRSPTGLKTYEESKFVVFDIWDITEKKFLPYYTVTMMCGYFNVPVVKLIGMCNCKSMDELYQYRDSMLEATVGEEGVVGKIYYKPHKAIEDNYLIFKEKHFIPKPVCDKFVGAGCVQLPQLPIEEVSACLSKVKDRLSPDEFKQMKTVMPAFAKEVALECEQQNCVNRINLKKLYDEIIEQQNRGLNHV